MSAFSRLVPEGKRACDALGKATRWPREEWARSIRTLERAGLFPEIGLEQVYGIVAKTDVPPDDVANMLIEQARAYVAEKVQDRLDANRTELDDLLPPTHPNGAHRYQAPTREQLDGGIEVGHMLADLPAGARVTLVPSAPAEQTTVCHARGRDYPAAPHLHDCRRLTDHETQHGCACGAIW